MLRSPIGGSIAFLNQSNRYRRKTADLKGGIMEKWLHVFRIRCEHLVQSDLFKEGRKPSDVISDSFRAHPAAEVGGGSEWHIAAAETFSGDAIAFQIGRVQSVTTPQYDDQSQRFYDAEGERAPYAHGVFDSQTQACVVERKSGVTAKAPEVAAKLEKLLNKPSVAGKAGFRIVVDALRDPESFIERIRQADRVTRFQFIAEFKNAHDVYQLIHEPAERYNETIKGEITTIETRGTALDKDIIEEMARSAASVGDPASATVIDGGESKGQTVYLRGTPLLEKISLPDGFGDIRDLMLSVLRNAYDRLRQPRDD